MYANTYFFPTSLLIYYIIKNLPVAKWEVVSLDILIYLIPNEMEQLISFLGLILRQFGMNNNIKWPKSKYTKNKESGAQVVGTHF